MQKTIIWWLSRKTRICRTWAKYLGIHRKLFGFALETVRHCKLKICCVGILTLSNYFMKMRVYRCLLYHNAPIALVCDRLSMLSHLKSNKDSFFQCDGLSDWVKSCGELEQEKEIPMGSKKGLTYVIDMRYLRIYAVLYRNCNIIISYDAGLSVRAAL